MPVVDVLVFGKDKMGQRLLDQSDFPHTQQSGPREVRLQDQPLLAEGEIAHRRQIVQVEVPRPRDFEFALGPAQFLILHLQLDLMHLQLVEQAPGFLGRQRDLGLGLVCAGLFLRPPTHVGRIVWMRLVLSHGLCFL